ncbi:DNA-processing protein DprA [Microbacterium halophytorum]|uniref:DNA-processing protein DprA n=1 Tax=Microbacterium halophytorum TaxID=2067568 RepID=UPI001E506493|nr:DNA-processing protein DprA [Microbacterium halophytorum]
MIATDDEVRDAAAALWPSAPAGERDERVARAAWTTICEPSDGVAGQLTAALGAAEALAAVERALRGSDPGGRCRAPGARSGGRGIPVARVADADATGGPVAGAAGAPVAGTGGAPFTETSRKPVTGSTDTSVVESAGVSAREWGAALERWRPRVAPRLVAESLRAARRSALTLLVPGDPDWSPRLADLGPHAPIALWVRGDAAAVGALERSASIVGARAATAYGEQIAGEFAGELALGGVGIVSGGAYGIDGAAHRAAVREGGLTVAVMAGGANRVYPAGHAHLLQRIAETGAVVSEVAPGAAPTKFRFLKRNRLIAALGAATIVVEAAHRSGTLSTAGAAAELGRPLGAVPGSVLSATSAGCHRLLREYDAVCVTTTQEVRELMAIGIDPGAVGGDLPLTAPVDPLTLRVRDALAQRAWRAPGEVAERSGVPIAEVTAALGLLRLEGAVEESGGGWRLAVQPALAARADRGRAGSGPRQNL